MFFWEWLRGQCGSGRVVCKHVLFKSAIFNTMCVENCNLVDFRTVFF